MFFLAHHDTIKFDTIYHNKIPPSLTCFKLFFIDYIHRRHIKESTLSKIESVNLVLIGGDFLERGVPLERVKKNILKLKRWGAPIYFVWGNNDYETDTDKLIQILQEENVCILEDSVIPISYKNVKINIVGFQYYKDYEQQPAIHWEKIEDVYTILLTHKPNSFYGLNKTIRKKIDLVLAGHTHGGQIRIFGLGFYTKGGI